MQTISQYFGGNRYPFTKTQAHKTVQKLVEAGSRLKDVNEFGETPLDIVKQYKDNYHRYIAPEATLTSLGFFDPDLNENYEADIIKKEEDKKPWRVPAYVKDHSLDSKDSHWYSRLKKARREAEDLYEQEQEALKAAGGLLSSSE